MLFHWQLLLFPLLPLLLLLRHQPQRRDHQPQQQRQQHSLPAGP